MLPQRYHIISHAATGAHRCRTEEYKKAKNIKEKAIVCSDCKVDLIVEDSLTHAIECAKRGIKVILFDKPWNQASLAENITRVKDWNEILQRINSLEI